MNTEYFEQFQDNNSVLIKNGTKMVDRDLVFMDLEMTGLKIDHEIIEIGWLRVDPKDLAVKEEYSIKIKPQRIDLADAKALDISHYNDKDWKDAVSIEEAMKLFIQKCSGCVLCGYNFFYDWSWIYNTLNNLNAFNPPFYYHKLDVMSMAYILLKDELSIDNFSLSDVCRYFGIERENCHTALYDAKYTFEVYKKLIGKLN